uniref:Uncharacterized protein n=1 Tax=Arundo donax TaxID=35708 RepID=A0A0A8ZVS3_ARUDO
MFIAVMRNFTDVFEKLLEISDSAHVGPLGQNVLHAAVTKGNPDIAKRIMEARPWLAREAADNNSIPTNRAAFEGKIEVLTVLLEYDRSLGYLTLSNGNPLLNTAAGQGHVGVARELLDHCPDAPYYNKTTGLTCLHVAVSNDRKEFVQFILGSQQLRMLVNMQDQYGQTALHLAARKCNAKMVTALLLHQAIDVTVFTKNGNLASRLLSEASQKPKASDL